MADQPEQRQPSALELAVNDYVSANTVIREFPGDEWNPQYRDLLALTLGKRNPVTGELDPFYYYGKTPDRVYPAVDELKAKLPDKEKTLKEKVTYQGLKDTYTDPRVLVEMLGGIPAVFADAGQNQELAEAHKAYFEAKQAYLAGQKMASKDQAGYIALTTARASKKSKADAAIAANDLIGSQRVDADYVLETKAALYGILEKSMPRPASA